MLPAKLFITLVIATKYNFSIGSVDLFVERRTQDLTQARIDSLKNSLTFAIDTLCLYKSLMIYIFILLFISYLK